MSLRKKIDSSRVGEHPCPRCWGPLVIDCGPYNTWWDCKKCDASFSNDRLAETWMLVTVFNDQRYHTAAVACKNLVLTGKLKGKVFGGPHDGMNWEREFR